MFIVAKLFEFIAYSIIAVISLFIVLMLIRLALNYADVNPFGRIVLFVRSLTDPYISPVRRTLGSLGIGPNAAPLVTILLVILVGWLALQLVASVLNTVAGVILSTQGRAPIALVGYVLYGGLALYSLLIFIRIIFQWGMVSSVNRVMRFLARATDPLLVPLSRMIPPLGMFDISPIIAFLILWLFQAAIAGTILRGWPVTLIG
jgi:YggT family protein